MFCPLQILRTLRKWRTWNREFNKSIFTGSPTTPSGSGAELQDWTGQEAIQYLKGIWNTSIVQPRYQIKCDVADIIPVRVLKGFLPLLIKHISDYFNFIHVSERIHSNKLKNPWKHHPECCSSHSKSRHRQFLHPSGGSAVCKAYVCKGDFELNDSPAWWRLTRMRCISERIMNMTPCGGYEEATRRHQQAKKSPWIEQCLFKHCCLRWCEYTTEILCVIQS